MAEKISVWNDAGKAGLVLGGVSAAYFAVELLGSGLQPGMGTALFAAGKFVLWIVKFVGCILLMKFFMKKFAAANPEATSNDCFRMGAATALLSALLYSALYLGYVGFINPDMLSDAIHTTMEQMSSMLDSNSRQLMEDMIPKLPAMVFFTNLIYCTLYGTLLSAILSRRIPSRNPFEGA